MTAHQPTTPSGEWRKASFSGSNNACVEMAPTNSADWLVRDSKMGDASPRLPVPASSMAALVRHVAS